MVQGTPRIELPTAHEGYSAVLPTCHGQNPESFGMVVSACFCVSMRDLPDPKEIANTSRKQLKFLDIRNSSTKHRPCLTLLKSAMYIHL